MNDKYIIDRVEGNYAIIEKENGDMYKISTERIRGDFKEADILINRNEYFEIDKNSTLNQKNKIKGKIKDMWEE